MSFSLISTSAWRRSFVSLSVLFSISRIVRGERGDAVDTASDGPCFYRIVQRNTQHATESAGGDGERTRKTLWIRVPADNAAIDPSACSHRAVAHLRSVFRNERFVRGHVESARQQPSGGRSGQRGSALDSAVVQTTWEEECEYLHLDYRRYHALPAANALFVDGLDILRELEVLFTPPPPGTPRSSQGAGGGAAASSPPSCRETIATSFARFEDILTAQAAHDVDVGAAETPDERGDGGRALFKKVDILQNYLDIETYLAPENPGDDAHLHVITNANKFNSYMCVLAALTESFRRREIPLPFTGEISCRCFTGCKEYL